MKNNETKSTILVVSTMSSGKSTIVNTILGEDILLSKNEACTSKLYHISSDKNLKDTLRIRCYKNDDLLLEQDVSIKDKELIKKYMIELNSHEDITKVELLSYFRDINNLSIIDTPGTNNSLDVTHMKKTIEAIKDHEYDQIMYILNATQMGTNDDRQLLECVKEYTHLNKEDIVFVLNKVDELDIEQDDSLDDIYMNSKMYLKSCGFENVKLFMTSAYLARLIKKEYDKEYLTRREERKLESLKNIVSVDSFNLDKFNNINIHNNYRYREQTHKERKIRRHREKRLKGTGIISLKNYLIRGAE